MRRVLLLLVPLLLVLALLWPSERTSEAAPLRGWDYVVRLDETLSTAEVRCCFRGFWPKRLISDAPGGLGAFTFPTDVGGARLTVRKSDQSLLPQGLSRSAPCVRWRVDLRAGGSRRRGAPRRVGRDVLLAPGVFLLRPALWPKDVRVSVRFELPEGFRVAVPWPVLRAGGYAVNVQATSLEGRMAIGRFTIHREVVAGATVEIAILDAPHAATPKGIRAWIVAAVKAVAALYGRFPTPKIVALVDPAPGRDPPVLFGSAMRAGGGHVHLLLANAAKDDSLVGEWVGVHELMHLGMPWTYDADAWLQEGFVTYYQEVLRARAGMLTEREAWQNIHDGFARGRRRGGTRSLELESRDMQQEHGYHRVYWAGAAVALLIDVELRRVSKGKRSLDDVIRWWREQHGGMLRPHRGVDLFRAVDRWLGGPLCSRIAEACLAERSFPEVEAVYKQLGLEAATGRIVLNDSAPLAAQRRAIMGVGAR